MEFEGQLIRTKGKSHRILLTHYFLPQGGRHFDLSPLAVQWVTVQLSSVQLHGFVQAPSRHLSVTSANMYSDYNTQMDRNKNALRNVSPHHSKQQAKISAKIYYSITTGIRLPFANSAMCAQSGSNSHSGWPFPEHTPLPDLKTTFYGPWLKRGLHWHTGQSHAR